MHNAYFIFSLKKREGDKTDRFSPFPPPSLLSLLPRLGDMVNLARFQEEGMEVGVGRGLLLLLFDH